ncbi:MAG: hypothetical protein GC145_09640 [Caulobacter sp.]|nr:hypothetical protein [Caulobacter sp.]
MIGHVGRTHITVRRRARWRGLSHASIDVTLCGDGETELLCRPGPHPLTVLITGGWLGLILAVFGLAAAIAVAGGVLERYWALLAAPFALFSALAAAFAFASGGPAEDRAFLIACLAAMTEATEA